MPNHTRAEMRVWIGFAASFSIAFLVTILAPEGMTWDQMEGVWIVAVSAGFINHGIWDHERAMVLSGSLSIAVTLISTAFAPMFFPVGWNVLGCGPALAGFYRGPRTEGLVSVYITLGGFIRLLSVYFSTSAFSVWMVWMVLLGLILITVSMESKNPVMHFWVPLGSWLPSSAMSSIQNSCSYLSPRLCRRDDRELRLSVQASWKNAEDRRDLLLCHSGPVPARSEEAHRSVWSSTLLIRGNIGAENVIQDLMSRLKPRCAPILLLGPTAPTQLFLPKEAEDRLGHHSLQCFGAGVSHPLP